VFGAISAAAVSSAHVRDGGGDDGVDQPGDDAG